MSPEPKVDAPPTTQRRPALALLGALGIALLALAATAQPDRVETAEALAEGNRLFREGQLEQAAETYRRGYSPVAPHPTLVYNLGATLHQLDRLPEAILWYRRAPSSTDPWLEENLWLARRSLGSQVLPPAGFLGTLSSQHRVLQWVAVGLAWLTLGALLFVPTTVGRWPVWVLAGLAIALFASAEALERWGPQPAILLTDCTTAAGDLPAGTEAWVRPSPGGDWQISGTQGVCPAESVAPVFPSD